MPVCTQNPISKSRSARSRPSLNSLTKRTVLPRTCSHPKTYEVAQDNNTKVSPPMSTYSGTTTAPVSSAGSRQSFRISAGTESLC
ncbi:hypothetical protein J6590_068928 [Homalodisca vitripennis]|nr:hypothetical protein J6590_068928 [Homalodisca vitripennis]